MLTTVPISSVPSYPVYDGVNNTDSSQASLLNYGNPKWKNPVGKFFKVIENGQAMKFLEKDNQEPAVTAIQDFVDFLFGWGSYSKKSSQEKKSDRAIEFLEKENQKSTVTAIGDFVNDLFGWRSYSKKSSQEKRNVLEKNQIQQDINSERCTNSSEEVTFYINPCETKLPLQHDCWEYPVGCPEFPFWLDDYLEINSTILSGPINTYTLSLFANKAGSEDTPTDIPEGLKNELSDAILETIKFSGKVIWSTKSEPLSFARCKILDIQQISISIFMSSNNTSIEYSQVFCDFFYNRMANYRDKILLIEATQENNNSTNISGGTSLGFIITVPTIMFIWYRCLNKKNDKQSFSQELTTISVEDGNQRLLQIREEDP